MQIADSCYSVYDRDKELIFCAQFALFLLFAIVPLCSLSAVTGGACRSSRGFLQIVLLETAANAISVRIVKITTCTCQEKEFLKRI